MPADTLDTVREATGKLRETVEALSAQENALATELATVKGKRQAVAKALAALEDDKPRKRRGRPRKADAAVTGQAAAA